MKKNLSILFILILILNCFLVNAAGVSSRYSKNYPLKLAPGESKEFSLNIQNMVGGQDLKFKAEISQGKEIAEITDESKEYFVPFGKSDIKVNLKVNAPKKPDKKEYDVTIKFYPISATENQGMVQIATGLRNQFTVQITEPKEIETKKLQETKSNSVWWVILISLISIIILILSAIIYTALKIRKQQLNIG